MKLKNKKGFTGMDYVVALLIFTGCLSLFVLMIGSMANDYENTEVIDEKFADNFDKFDESTTIARNMFETMNEKNGTGLSFADKTELFFTGGFGVINLLFSSVSTGAIILFTFPTYFGFDLTASIIMMTLIFAILTVYIIFSVINSLRGNKL